MTLAAQTSLGMHVDVRVGVQERAFENAGRVRALCLRARVSGEV